MAATVEFTANGSSDLCSHHGGDLMVQAAGTFGSGTLVIKADIGIGLQPLYSWTAGETKIFELPSSCQYQYELTGATSPSIQIAERAIGGVTKCKG